MDDIEFQHMVDAAINLGKSSLSFQIYGYNNQWVCDMVEKLCAEEPYYMDKIDDVCGAEIYFKE